MLGALKRFLTNSGGNFAITAAILSVPLVLAAGVMVDLTTISRSRAELQQAMDAAVLAVAREGDNLTNQQAEQIVRSFLKNNYQLTFANLNIMRQGTSVTIDATADTNMAFGSLFGYQDWTVAAASTADIAYASYEIALVLDTTGSMAGGKLTAMKDAVDGLIESMSAQIQNKNRLMFSLVPFATFVNVGPQYGPRFDAKGIQIPGTGAPWLDLKGNAPIPQVDLQTGISRFQVYRHLNKEWKGCVETRMRSGGKDYDIDDTRADQSKPETLYIPAFASDEGDTGGYINSYLEGKVDPLGINPGQLITKLLKYGILQLPNKTIVVPGLWRKVAVDDSPSGYQGFDKGPDFGCGTQPITPLTNDYNALRNKVRSFEARGNTNIMEGVSWGMRVLSSGEPFGQGRRKDTVGVEKIMIVLTDGSNTMGVTDTDLGSNYSSFGYLSDGRLGPLTPSGSATNAAMNERTLAACNYAKAQGIELYTIRLEEPDVKTGTMLQQCATSADHYFDAPSRSQLDDVFKEIRERVVRLRLAS
ncbi:MAG: VWA domain-containing protein [Rhizobiaceae bacterium]|nr:VWA domain-containing protein [Rhizobiaceae bacterium]